MYPAFLRALKKSRLVLPGDTILISVSGGVDSMSLLHLFHRIQRRWKLQLHVLHVNHLLRGDDADADEQLVRASAERCQATFHLLRQKPSPKKNLQDAARRLRHMFQQQVAQEIGAHAVALAHQQEDQAETLLLHLLRGSGLAGLCGMRSEENIGGCRIIRPLLHMNRASIEEYATQQHISFRHDSSNQSTHYRRNWVRHHVLPLLQQVNPRVIHTLANTAAVLQADDHALQQQGRKAAEEHVHTSEGSASFSRDAFLQLPEAVRRRALMNTYATLTGSRAELSSDHLRCMEHILLRQSGAAAHYHLPRGCIFHRSRDQIVIRKL